MSHTKQIALVLTDTLQSIGLQTLLTDYFPPVKIHTFDSVEAVSAYEGEAFDYYFTDTTHFILHTDYFLPRRSKTIVLISQHTNSQRLQATGTLSTTLPEEALIEQLEELFRGENSPFIAETDKELSQRETDVLQEIVKGKTNKEIADRLNISLNTVLSHRKNITAKLGIKTVSGLTFYAIMNGLISGEEIEL